MASEATPTPTAGVRVQHEMLDDGRKLVDAARAEGLTLRLLGGLAVREHCRTFELCERDYSDLDMVAPFRHARRLVALFARFGYAENYDVSTATANRELQFTRPCGHGVGEGSPPSQPKTTSTSSSTRSAWTTTSPSPGALRSSPTPSR